MRPRYRLEYLREAEHELFDIQVLIRDYAGDAVARRKLAEIETVTYNLCDYPKIGTVHDELMPGMRAIPAGEKAVVCFTVDDESMTVLIVCISYAGSDWQARVKNRI